MRPFLSGRIGYENAQSIFFIKRVRVNAQIIDFSIVELCHFKSNKVKHALFHIDHLIV
jgi:hypothetical protein